MERLVFIEKGLQQAEQGKVTDHDKVKELTKKWPG
jgi:predicted transcriptional regulator